MAKTLAQIEAIVSRLCDDYVSGTTSSAGNAGGTTVVTTSEDVMTRPGQSWVPHILEITSGTYDNQVRQVSDFTVSAGVGTLTVVNAYGGQIAISVTFRLHRIPPSWKKQAIDDALRSFSSVVPLVLSEDIITGENLRNSHLEFWRTAAIPYDWDTIAGTIAREGTTVYQGRYSLKLTGAAGVGSVRQRIELERELNGVALTLTAYVYGTAAAGIYLRITQGTTNGDSTALAATNTWTQLTATLTPANAYQPLFVSLVNTTAVAAYFDLAHLYSAEAYTRWVPYSSAYQQLANLQSGPYYAYDRMPQFYERGYGFTPERHYFLTSGNNLRLTGVGLYPTLSADTDEVDLSEEEALLLASKAAIIVLGRCIATTHLSQNDKWSELQAMLMRDDAKLTSQLRRQTPALRIGSWRD